MKIATVKEMREIDKAALDEYGIPEILLMENAGRETCQAALDLFDGLPIRRSACWPAAETTGAMPLPPRAT